MKRIAFLSIPVISLLLLAGCGEKPADTASPSTTEPAPPSTTADQVKGAASKAADEVMTEVKKQSAEVVAEAQKQATAVYADLSQQLTASNKGTSDELTKNISTDLQDRVQKLSDSLKGDETLTQKLGSSVKALLNNNDGEAVGGFGGLSEAKLTPEQTTLAKDVYNAAAALVTERNFSSVEGMNSDVSQLATAVWKGNYTEALPPLQKLYGQATLTPQQKDLLGKMYDGYLPAGWKDSAAKLQQGLDSLKKFGQ